MKAFFLFSKPDDLNSTPETHMVKEKIDLSSDLCHVHTHTHTWGGIHIYVGIHI